MKKKETNIQSRIIRAVPHKDGSPGMLYLRLRIGRSDPRLKSVRIDLPLLTDSRWEAGIRACVLFRALHSLGRRVMGDIELPPTPPRPHQRKSYKSKPPLPPLLPGAGKWD